MVVKDCLCLCHSNEDFKKRVQSWAAGLLYFREWEVTPHFPACGVWKCGGEGGSDEGIVVVGDSVALFSSSDQSKRRP